MTAKTIKARNVQTKTPVAYLGTESNPLPVPVFCTAYQRDGVTVFAAPSGITNAEVYPDTRVIIDYDPANVPNIKGLRWCHTHEGEEPHLRLITRTSGSGWCGRGYSDRHKARIAKGYTSVSAMLAEQKKEDLDTAVLNAMARAKNPPTREHLNDITLRNIARDLGTGSRRFAVMAAQCRIPLAEAVTRANRALAEAGQIDASTTTTASSEVA